MCSFTVKQIGVIRIDENGYSLVLEPAYRSALAGIEDFSHVQVIWWFSGCDTNASRTKLTEHAPYQGGPETLGVFATRSPERPNPLALSCAGVTYVDAANGTVGLTYIDGVDGSPLLDIKPYTPSLDRVESPSVPDWCANWPKNVETSGDFDWGMVFRF